MVTARKPMRLFKSPLTGAIYASSAYRDLSNGLVEITGKKDDVTDDFHALATDPRSSVGVFYCIAHEGVANEDERQCDFARKDRLDDKVDPCDFRACLIDRRPEAKVDR